MSLMDGWREEMQSAFLYQVLVETEQDEVKRRLFSSMREAALSQAQIVLDKIQQDGGTPPPAYRPSIRARVVAGSIPAAFCRCWPR